MRRATLVLTDSGGIQEEAPTFGVPTLVLRDTTERPITVEFGTNTLLGLRPDRIGEIAALFDERRPARTIPFWDGDAGGRAAAVLAAALEGAYVRD